MTQKIILKSVTVEKIFGDDSYTLDFFSGPVTVLHGPNGVGKTTILKMIHAALAVQKEHQEILKETTFDELTITFSDDSALRISKKELASSSEELEIDEDLLEAHKKGVLHYRITTKNESISFSEGDLYTLDLAIDEPDEDRDETEDDVIEYAIRNGYDRVRHLPRSRTAGALRNPLNGITHTMEEWIKLVKEDKSVVALRNFCRERTSHIVLVESGRLNDKQSDEDDFHFRRRRHRYLHSNDAGESEKTVVIPTVNVCSRSAKDKIRETKESVGDESRRLDSELIHKLISDSLKEYTDDEIHEQYRKFQTLISDGVPFFGHSEQSLALEIPETLTKTARHFLGPFLDHLLEKYEPQRKFITSAKLFEELLNSRFRKKNVHINHQDGITITKRSNNSTIPLTRLSSGEQHQLVLMYKLLFEFPNNSLVIIDEPEISLHLVWQYQFINSLLEIIKLKHRNHRYILATHSPAIVDEHYDCMISIGDDEVDDE